MVGPNQFKTFDVAVVLNVAVSAHMGVFSRMVWQPAQQRKPNIKKIEISQSVPVT